MGLCFVFNALAARLHLQRRHGRAKTVQNPGKGNEVENDRVPAESPEAGKSTTRLHETGAICGQCQARLIACALNTASEPSAVLAPHTF